MAEIDDAVIWNRIHNKTKPLHALGRLEEIAFQICKIQNTLEPVLKPIGFIFAADHGIAEEGVSAYPQEVTYQMVLNFLRGGAAMNVFCRQHGIPLYVVDAGVKGSFERHPHLLNYKIRESTRNFLKEPAMKEEEMKLAIDYGREIIETYARDYNLLITGEMGIANTTSASAILYALTDIPAEECVGYGTGISDEQRQKKIDVIRKAIRQYGIKHAEPLKVLQYVGGFEIAMMTGAYLQALEKNFILLVDGFIASVSFYIAYLLKPEILQNTIFSHVSKETGHRKLLSLLNREPLLQLNMGLGEGTGAAVCYPILESAVRFLKEMADFDSAGVSKATG